MQKGFSKYYTVSTWGNVEDDEQYEEHDEQYEEDDEQYEEDESPPTKMIKTQESARSGQDSPRNVGLCNP